MKTLGKENIGIVGFSYEVTNQTSEKPWIIQGQLGRKTDWKTEVAHGYNWSEQYSSWFSRSYGHSHIYLGDKGPFYSIVGGYTDYTNHNSTRPNIKADEWGVETGNKFCLRQGYAWNRFLNEEGYSRTYIYLIQKEGINNFLGSRIRSTSKDSTRPWIETNFFGERKGKEIKITGSYGWSQQYGEGYNHFSLYTDEALNLDDKNAFWGKINEIERERKEAKEQEERRVRELEEKARKLAEDLNKAKSEEAAKNAAIRNLEIQLERERNKNKLLEEQATSSKSEDRGTIAEIEIPPKK